MIIPYTSLSVETSGCNHIINGDFFQAHVVDVVDAGSSNFIRGKNNNRPEGPYQKFLPDFFQKVGRRRLWDQQDGLKGSFRCSLAHPAGARLGIDRTKRLHARPVQCSKGALRANYKNAEGVKNRVRRTPYLIIVHHTYQRLSAVQTL